MSTKINNKMFLQTLAAGAMVTTGVIIKNSNEQGFFNTKMLTKDNIDKVGVAFFTIGWIYVAYMLSMGKKNKLVYWIPSMAILASVMMMKMKMKKNEMVPHYLPAVFAASWIALGFFTSNHMSGNMKYSGLIASAFVLISMLYVLPMQRKKCVVDGPGMPLFTLAWVIIAALNSKN